MNAPDSTPASEAARVVQGMGGIRKVARFFGISQPAVSQWLAAGQLPAARRRHLQDVRPDLFVAQQGAETAVRDAA